MTSKWLQLAPFGQSVWYDNVARPALRSGLLARIVREDGVTGGTSNPSIFAKAVTESDLYDDDIRAADPDVDVGELFARLAVADIQEACDVLRPAWEASGGQDGYISLEVEASMAFDEDATVERAVALRGRVDRPNVMIKVPGTITGVQAFRRLIREGISINVTLLFATQRYREVAEAYVAALAERHAAGEPLGGIASVASFFVSRIDSKADAILPADSPLRGQTAIANAKLAYADVFRPVFSGERWQALADAGARVQRPLWASTSTKNPDYRPSVYVDELIGPDTVTTVPDVTLEAFRGDGRLGATLEHDVEGARAVVAALPAAGVDLDHITSTLEREGVDSFSDAYTGMIEAIAGKRARINAD